MTIRVVRPGVWDVDVCITIGDEERRRQKRIHGTKRDAKDLENELREELKSGIVAPARRPTVAAFSKDLLTHARAHSKPSDVASKESILRVHINPAMGDVRIDEVTPQRVTQFKGSLMEKGLAHKTVNNILIVLSRLLRLADEYGKLKKAPKVKLLKVDKQKFDYLDHDETQRLIDAGGDYQSMIVVAARTGLRQGELLGLRWEDVDLKARRIFVRQAVSRGRVGTPKNHRERIIPLSGEATSALRGLDSRLQDGLVWPWENGRPMPHWYPRNGLWRACRRAGIRRIGWHVLRHTFASHLAMAGVPLVNIQRWLGHHSITQTERYSHLAPGHNAGLIDVLDSGGHRGRGVDVQGENQLSSVVSRGE